MRLVTFKNNDHPCLGLVDNQDVLTLSPADGWPASLLDLIEAGPDTWQRLKAAAPALARGASRRPLDTAGLLAPIPRPRKNVMCIGWNYAEHVSESAAASKREDNVPTDPVVFTKNVTSVVGPYDDIPAQPAVTTQLDWEVELGVIIGVGGRGIPRERALAHVFGYTVVDDVSARDLQFRHKQFFLGKSLDGTCPMGPMIVTADEIPDPQNLALRCRVNGVLKQDSSTRHMIFDVATIISVLSRGMALEPGDIIATGTPSGVGFARQPPEYLRTGDVVECEIDGIGLLRNRLV
jgi:2-keto-4-pentenoate hydratase/2-oxohepta-3-ene-1,7-dioic acid hydratase in catechol pathway